MFFMRQEPVIRHFLYATGINVSAERRSLRLKNLYSKAPGTSSRVGQPVNVQLTKTSWLVNLSERRFGAHIDAPCALALQMLPTGGAN